MRFTKPKKSTLIISGILIGIGMIGIVTALIIGAVTPKNDSSSPSFNALLPTGTSIDELGGWQKLAPPNSDPYYVFVDSINDVLIRVSQQQLPASFKDSTDAKISELAKGYNATQTFEVGGTKVYIGNTTQGPQSVIFTKEGVLVSIVSNQAISEDAWKSYIQSLT